MNVTWILEPDMCPMYYENLAAEVAAQRHVLLTIPAHYTTLEWGDTSRYYDDFAPEGSCVVCHASFQFAAQVAADELWTPGTYGIGAAVNCSQYFPHFDGCLLNSDYELIALEDLAPKADSLFKSFGINDRIFIRPDSGGKPFTGRLFTRTELTPQELRSVGISPNALVVVSRPKSIRYEWRFIIADRSAIAGSMYRDSETIRMSPEVKPAAFDFASVVATRDFQPDRVWVLDLCETTDGELKIVEINGFSSSSWYCCNVRDVVAAVSRVALDDWKRRTPTTAT